MNILTEHLEDLWSAVVFIERKADRALPWAVAAKA